MRHPTRVPSAKRVSRKTARREFPIFPPRGFSWTKQSPSGRPPSGPQPMAQPLPGTDDAAYPFWSPDSRFIAYFAQQRLLKIAASGGPPQTLCNAGGAGGSWGQDGTIVFNIGRGKTLSRVSSAGGQPEF